MADPTHERTRKHAKLKLDQGFRPCVPESDDELYPNGIFEFNISRLWAFIHAHGERFRAESVALRDIPDYGGDDRLDQAAIEAADLCRPILLAEISPGHFNVIDGHHRVAKAKHQGLRDIRAVRVQCPDHIAFLTSTRAYTAYVDYWNSKLTGDSSRSRRAGRAARNLLTWRSNGA